mgnify:CR=1 FL=1
MDTNIPAKLVALTLSLVLLCTFLGCQTAESPEAGLGRSIFVSENNERYPVDVTGSRQVVRFVQFKNGIVKLPLIVRPQPRFGAMFRVREESFTTGLVF